MPRVFQRAEFNFDVILTVILPYDLTEATTPKNAKQQKIPSVIPK